MLDQVKNVILILSGKGGVGKSSISTQLALTMAIKGYRVGLLDIDLCGPSIPRMLGLDDCKVEQGERGWIPIPMINLNLFIMSIGFLLPQKDGAVIWRGPKKNSMIQQFINNVDWDELDYLIIDTPPGTSDEHLSILDILKLNNKIPQVILVTTPQLISLSDVRKTVTFCSKVNLPIIGYISNMDGYVCPGCKESIAIFGKSKEKENGNGNKDEISPFNDSIQELASIPLYPSFNKLIDNPDRQNLPIKYREECNELYQIFNEIINKINNK